MKKFLLRRLLFIPLGIAALIATLFARYHPGWTEQVYSRSVYPVLSSLVGYLPSLVGFSLTEWLVALLVLFCLGYVACAVRRVILSRGGRGMAAYRGLAGAAAIFCTVYFIYTALCGLNYHRYTFTSYTGYEVQPSGVAELEQLCSALAGDLGQVREQLGEDTDPDTAGPGDFAFYARRSVSAMQELAQQYPVLDRPLYSAPKPVVMSGLMSKAGIGGVFFSFTLESNINTEAPFFTQPSTMAHELAHQCGFMREDEANFIAYLACKQADEPLMQYSGLFSAYAHAISALQKADRELAAEVMATLSEAVRRDMAAYQQFWVQNQGVVSSLSSSVNDLYLKANNQVDGVASYNRMVDLLLAEQRAAG